MKQKLFGIFIQVHLDDDNAIWCGLRSKILGDTCI